MVMVAEEKYQNVPPENNNSNRLDDEIEDLIYYVRTNDIEELKKILQHGNISSINDVKDENGNTLLHFACANNTVDMIRFLLYECTIGHNQVNTSGNSPLMWAIQNKHCEAVKEVLLFDYLLYRKEYTAVERKKNELYEHMRKDFLEIHLVKDGYQLSAHVKNKINSMNFFASIFFDDDDGSFGNGDNMQGVGGATLNIQGKTWGKQIRLYKEANKIDLLKKNEFNKSILSEAFNAQDENILHLVLSHPISSVLDDQDARAVSGMSSGVLSGVANGENGARNSHDGTAFTTNLEDAKIIQECTHELLINEKAKVKNEEIEEQAIIRIREIGLNYFGNSFEDGKTSGEEVHSHNDITGINIWECCLVISKWISDLCLQNATLFSNKAVLELGGGTGLASISLFTHANVFRDGNEQGPNQVVITDVNPFTLSNISHNVSLNEELLGNLDSEWRRKIKICNIDWTNENTYPRENEQMVTYDYIIGSDLIYDKKIVPSLIHLINLTLKPKGTFLYVCRKNRDGSQEFFDELQNGNYDIQLFTPPSHYFISSFLNLSQDLYEAKFSEFTDASNFVMMRCQKY
ncbi:hypothetical protein C922_02423 [Plasmodium inui San Antonio 1]|uniref:Uncharacterized protein n=1 Tax=Plasmodium inui San Antonio 1 TaxID=1237626 RepID=W7A7J6_9APIC|nr:hypothetical protein C922_02423 [Plasmodium inui San Antonio 1]EUD67273.1 hypothetical protein C922_02423 [Plasmodium inui San Antonio 1]